MLKTGYKGLVASLNPTDSLLDAMAWAARGDAKPSPRSNPSQFIIMIGAVVFFFWLIVLRPQKKEKQDRQQMLDMVKKGDRVVTIGGIHGKVSDVDETRGVITVEVAPKTAMKVDRSAIRTVDSKGSDKGEGAGTLEKK